jgi:hypothetical protein
LYSFCNFAKNKSLATVYFGHCYKKWTSSSINPLLQTLQFRLIKTRKKIYYNWRDASSLFILNTVFFLSLSLATFFLYIFYNIYVICPSKHDFDPLYHKAENFRTNWKHISITPPSFMKFCPVVPEICRGQVHGTTIESYGKVEISYINVDNF